MIYGEDLLSVVISTYVEWDFHWFILLIERMKDKEREIKESDKVNNEIKNS